MSLSEIEQLLTRMTITNGTTNSTVIQPLQEHSSDTTTITNVGMTTLGSSVPFGLTYGAFLLEFITEPVAVSGTDWAAQIIATGGRVRGVLIPATASGHLVPGIARSPMLPIPTLPRALARWGAIFCGWNDSGSDQEVECAIHLRRERKKQED